MKRLVLVFAAAAVVLGGSLLASRLLQSPGIAPLPDDRVEASATIEGVEFKIADGLIYRVDDRGQWHYHDTAYDPELVARSYAREGDVLYRVDPDSGRRFPVYEEFRADFETEHDGAAGLRELIGERHGWTTVTLQSPEAPEVPDYVALRQRVLQEGSDFADAVVAPSAERAATGRRALRCVAPACPGAMVCTKASLSTGLVHFTQGEEVWFRGRFFVAGDVRPYSLVDLECEFLVQQGGIRIVFDGPGALAVELKALDKPKYRQPEGEELVFPTDRWVEVAWAVRLEASPAGRVRLWQDGALVLDATGRTLPLPSTIYNSLEVGASAHDRPDAPATVFLDDLRIAGSPPASAASPEP